jgi:hypothetical protein
MPILRSLITGPVWESFAKLAYGRDPDVYIGGKEDTYLERWWVIPRNPFFNVYLHHVMRSDDDRALHSHPWLFNLSLILAGSYVEHAAEGKVERKAGDLKLRIGPAFHRLEITDGACWTLFITGPKCRMWGFRCPKGFVPWTQYVLNDGLGSSTIGGGCGEFA